MNALQTQGFTHEDHQDSSRSSRNAGLLGPAAADRLRRRAHHRGRAATPADPGTAEVVELAQPLKTMISQANGSGASYADATPLLPPIASLRPLLRAMQ